MLVRAPASSANLGPGFDCLGLAVDLPFWLGTGDEALRVPGRDGPVGMLEVEATHPARAAFAAAGGDPAVGLSWRSRIPPGRGLGFSGAARVAGAYAASRLAGHGDDDARELAATVAATLEGHPDNAAASAFGGLTVSAGGTTLRAPFPAGVDIALWWPDETASTDASRASLPDEVAFADAAFSVGRAALWVAAAATGDLSALAAASEDRLHQPPRLVGMPASAAALAAMRADPGCLGAWLSGSGPGVAGLFPADGPDPTGLPEGHSTRVAVDRRGVRPAGAVAAPG